MILNTMKSMPKDGVLCGKTNGHSQSEVEKSIVAYLHPPKKAGLQAQGSLLGLYDADANTTCCIQRAGNFGFVGNGWQKKSRQHYSAVPVISKPALNER